MVYNIMFETRKYIVIPASAIREIDFSEVLETAPDTCRYSVSGEKTFVKWEGEMPDSVRKITDESDALSHSEILEILKTSEWTAQEVGET